MLDDEVLVETFIHGTKDGRQIGSSSPTRTPLKTRRKDIESAIAETSEIIQDAMAKAENNGSAHITRIEAKFGLSLSADAGVVISRISAAASFEVTLIIERG